MAMGLGCNAAGVVGCRIIDSPRERLIAIAFLLVLAVLSFIYWQVWQYGIGMIAFFILLWGGGLGLILWIYRKKFLNRIHEIKKNLSELNELM